eukprot:Colp12_sorted_trinity150504_noHs@9920
MASDDSIGSIDRYNPENIPRMEETLRQTIMEPFNLDEGLTLLKLYQFNPSRLNLDVVRLILLKALTALPKTDFLLCSYLVHEKYHSDATIGRIIELARYLETTNFPKFWEEFKKNPKIAEDIPNFKLSIQTYVAAVLKHTYQRISSDVLALFLGEDGSVAQAASQQGMTEEDGMWVVGAAREVEKKQANVYEKIEFESLNNILATSAVL